MKALDKKEESIEKKELSPKLIEEATMEIIKESVKILQDYGLKGVVTEIEVGMIPVHGKKIISDCPENYSYNYSDLFTLMIERDKCQKGHVLPMTLIRHKKV